MDEQRMGKMIQLVAPEAKPGKKTTEFALSLAAIALQTAVLFGFDPAKAQTLAGAITLGAQAFVTGAAVFGYNLSRGKAKSPNIVVQQPGGAN